MHKLLIADGSPTMHRIIELTFAREPVQVVAASDGDQAIALLPIARPDIVIADHALSGKSGYEIADFVRRHPDLSSTPVLLLAGAFEPIDRERAEAAGVAGEITKPFDPAQLIARVHELLAPPPPPPAEPAPQVAESAPVAQAAPAAADGRVPDTALAESPGPARAALDDYFDRLDAALRRLDEQMSAGGADAGPLPTLDRLLGSDEAALPQAATSELGSLLTTFESLRAQHEASRSETALDHLPAPLEAPPPEEALPEEAPPGAGMSPVPDLPPADLASGGVAEAAEGGPGEVGVEDARPASVIVTDELVEEVTRRVIARLAPDAADRLVAPLVDKVIADVAERLVAEALERLREPRK